MRFPQFSKRALLFIGSLLFIVYVMAPIGWLVSSSLQSEAEVTSVPPHWVPHMPTIGNFAAIFKSGDQADDSHKDGSNGDANGANFIPSTAKNLLPSMWNSFVVAVVVVILNLLVSVPAAYAMAKIRFIGRNTS